MAPPVILLLITAQMKKGIDIEKCVKKKKVIWHCNMNKKKKKMICIYATFILRVDVVTYVQVEVCDLEMVRRLAYVVGTEQLGHGRTLVSCCGRLLGAHLLG